MSFLERFFTQRGPFEPNARNEAAVRCPFPHDKGYDTRASAHINVNEKVFHCKTCRAEGRFHDGGLSEIGFVAEFYNVSYEEACAMMALEPSDSTVAYTGEAWERAREALPSTEEYKYLTDRRGLTEATINKYELGYQGGGIGYPVYIYGEIIDVRTYHPDSTPKIISTSGSTVLLFPFDHWREDDRPTLLVGGENDALIGRQLGFNALTTTGGEGSFPKIFLSLFKNRDVYVCYDCDEAGKHSSKDIAFLLKGAGANVLIVDLGLPGTKDDKDLSDFVVKHGFGYDEVQKKLDEAKPFSEEEMQKVKNRKHPLTNLWDVARGDNSGQYLSAQVTLSGKYDMPMQTPSAIEWTCKRRNNDCEACANCTLQKGESRWWTLNEDTMREVLYMVDVNESAQNKKIQALSGIPADCPGHKTVIRARQEVQKVVFTPDVETEDELTGFRAVEQYAYVLGMNLEDGARYRAYFRPFPHPLDEQRVYMMVYKVEDSDNAFNTFKMTPDMQRELQVFQGDPFEMMAKRAEMAKDIVGTHAHPNVVNAVDILYHSPLDFYYAGRLMKGFPEGVVVGESRTGKTSVAVPLQRFYGLGNFAAVKSATVAGLLGGAEKLPSGGHKISWGMIPRNHKSLVILDEMSGMPKDVLAAMTDLRSSGMATVTKIVRGRAPAKTRILWMSNPQQMNDGTSRALYDYTSGIQMLLDLVGTDEDIARFDFVVSLIAPEDGYTSPFEAIKEKAHDVSLYRNLIYWVWTRAPEQIVFEPNIEKYAWQVAQELNEKYNTNVKLFGPEANKKLARIAVACAGACFSCTDNGQGLLVKKCHIDWAADFLTRQYDNDIFRLRDYVREHRQYTETNEAVNAAVAKICNKNAIVIRTLINSPDMNLMNLRMISGMEASDFSTLVNDLYRLNLVRSAPGGSVRHTRRLKRAVDAYRENYHKQRMIPLDEQGGFSV